MDQASFGIAYGVSQQTVSVWDRGDRGHVGAKLLDTPAEKLVARPDTIYTDEGQAFWVTVAAVLAVPKGAETTPTIREIVRAVVARRATAASRPS